MLIGLSGSGCISPQYTFLTLLTTDDVDIIKPKLAIPCHFWNFAEHGGEPDKFVKEMKNTYQSENFILMPLGETIRI